MRKRGEVTHGVRAGMAEGLSPKEIAARVGIRVEHVYATMQRLRGGSHVVRLPEDVLAQLKADPQRPRDVSPADWSIAILRDALPQILGEGRADG